MNASYFGLPTLLNRNPDEISIANFTVLSGQNALYRDPVPGGGRVENGALKGGETVQTNVTRSTETGEFFVTSPAEDVIPDIDDA